MTSIRFYTGTENPEEMAETTTSPGTETRIPRVVDKDQEQQKFPPSGAGSPKGIGFYLLHLYGASLFISIVVASLGFDVVNDALSFYGVYHRDPINQLIHFVFVPCITWTYGIMFAHTSILPIGIELPGVPLHYISYSTLSLAYYAYFYVKIDPIGGTLYLPVMYLMYASAFRIYIHDQKKKSQQNQNEKKEWTGTGGPLRFAFFWNFVGWAIQIWSHYYFEGGKPAIAESIGGSLTVAPLFAFYEGLWVLGINTGLKQTMLTGAATLTRALCHEDPSVMRACASLT